MKTFLESINAAAKYPVWILTAIRENKPIECRITKGGTWVNCISIYDGDYSPDEFEYRIKPTPTLRPWRPEEAINYIGRPIKCISTGSVYLITGWCCVTPQKLMTSGGEHYLTELSKTYVVTLDHGKTWLPCGVVE